MKECVVCNMKIEGHQNKKYCDAEECQAVKKAKSGKNKKYQKICPECGCSFMGFIPRKYCEDCSKTAILKNKRTCIVCGSVFEGHYNKHYCDSEECQAEKKERSRLQSLKYASKPEAKRKRLERERREDVKQKRREYLKRPEVRKRLNAWHREYQPKWAKENPEKVKAYQKKFASTEKGRLMRQRANRKRLSTPKGKITNRVRSNVYKHLKLRGLTKGGRTFELLGYTGKELYDHLESQFTDGMSWENMGEWHIDHIRPVASFNFDSTDHPEFKKCWSLDNLQPLWAADNLVKSDKWDEITNE